MDRFPVADLDSESSSLGTVAEFSNNSTIDGNWSEGEFSP
jgi:hypothetical protein